MGEIGLSGECRSVSSLELRIKEAERLGFSRILVPDKNMKSSKLNPSDFNIKIEPIKGIYDAVSIALK